MSSLPIVFIHKGNSWYLPYTLYQAHVTNPDSDIFLIGDCQTLHFPSWVKHIDYSDYNDSLSELLKVYQHHSSLGKDFELVCIERWFVLYAFMVDKKIDKCVYLDSDVLVYSDLSAVHQLMPAHSMTWLGFSAHTNFINDINSLKLYCDNVIDSYCDNLPENIKNKTFFFERINNNNNMNISDMTFWADYNLRYPGQLLDISKACEYGAFDISTEHSFEYDSLDNDFKKIYFKGMVPYCKTKSGQEYIPFLTLHFAAKTKFLLKQYFQYSTIEFKVFRFVNNIRLLIISILRKLKLFHL